MDIGLKVSFKDFCDVVVSVISGKVKADKGDIPFTIATYKNGKHAVHPFLCTSGSPMDYAQQVIDKEAPEMYCIACVGWMKRMSDKAESKEYLKNYKWGDMKDDPKKDEGLFFMGKTLDGTETYSKTFLIHRDTSGTTLEEFDSGEMHSPKLT